jgi:hypothetical protein
MNAWREEIASHFDGSYVSVEAEDDETAELCVVDCTGSGRHIRLDATQVLLLTRALVNALRAKTEETADERCNACEVIKAIEAEESPVEAIQYVKQESTNYVRHR